MRPSTYRIGLDALGTQYGPTPDFVGPMSPQQLEALDRALTPAAYQSGEADKQLAEVRREGGPRSKTVEVTEKGAVIQARPRPVAATPWSMPWWGWALIAAGGVGAVGGIVAVARRKR